MSTNASDDGSSVDDSSNSDSANRTAEQSPYLRILRGHPTPAELAALVVALQTLGTDVPEPATAASSGWAAYWRSHRQNVQPGPGAWRHSLRGWARVAGGVYERPAPSATVRSARLATYVIFGLNGLVFASWAARVPAVAEILGLNPGTLGLLLLMTGLGSVLGLPLAGRIITRLGTAQTIRCAWAVIAGALCVVSVSLWQVHLVPTGAALFVLGFAIGVWDVSQNIEGAEVERRLGVTIMPRFHAAFSGGAFVGALLGALFGRIGVSLSVHLVIIVVVGSVITVLCARRFLPAGDAAHDVNAGADGGRARSAWLEPRTLVIGLVVLGAAFTEGSANDWLAKATVDGLGASQAVGSAVFALFVLSMTAFRFAGSSLVDRLGRVTTVRICLAASLVGLVVFVFAPDLPVASVGAIFWGVGAALGFPLGMSAAADDAVRAAARVSVVSTIGYGAFLLGPPVLGLIGDEVGVRRSLLLVGAVVLLSLLTVPAIRPPAVVTEDRPAG